MIHGLDALQQQLQHSLAVAHDVVVGLHVLVDFGAVDVDLHDLRILCEGGGLQGHAVRETATHSDQQVAGVHGHIGGLGAVHADHAGDVLVPALEAAGAHQRHRCGGVDPVDQCANLLMGPGANHAAAADDHGLLALCDHLHQGLDIRVIGLGGLEVLRGTRHQRRQIAVGGMETAAQGLVIRDFCRDVLGNVQQHGAGSAAAGDGEGLADGVSQLVYVPHQVVALGDGHRDAGDIDLLEGILAQQRSAHIAGDAHDRGGVHIGGGNAGDEVGAAGAGGGEAHADLAGGTGVAVRCMARALLVGGEDVLDAAVLLVVQHFVIDVEDGAAGIAEDGVDMLFKQAFHQDLGAGHLHGGTSCCDGWGLRK